MNIKLLRVDYFIDTYCSECRKVSPHRKLIAATKSIEEYRYICSNCGTQSVFSGHHVTR